MLSWTPLGAAWAVPGDVADGQWATAAARFGIAVATLLVVVVVWDRAFAHALVNPAHEKVSTRGHGLGWFDRLPATPLGAVTARCLTYWARDPRYALAVAIVPILAIVFYVVSPDGGLVLLIGPIAGYLMGWGISADVAYDGTAFWTHVAAPLHGTATGSAGSSPQAPSRCRRSSSCGRLGAAGRAAGGRPRAAGLSFGVLLTALGGSSVLSALVVYPVQLPGENPFQTKQGASMATVLSQFAGWLAVMALSLPEIGAGGARGPGRVGALGWADPRRGDRARVGAARARGADRRSHPGPHRTGPAAQDRGVRLTRAPVDFPAWHSPSASSACPTSASPPSSTR